MIRYFHFGPFTLYFELYSRKEPERLRIGKRRDSDAFRQAEILFSEGDIQNNEEKSSNLTRGDRYHKRGNRIS